MSKQAKLLGLQIQCPRQLPTRNIPRDKFRLGPMDKRRKYWIVQCDCGDVHRIRAQHHDTLPTRFLKPASKRKAK